MPFEDDWNAALAPWQTPSLTTFVTALSQMWDEVNALVYEQGVDGNPDFVPGWGSIFDPDLCADAYLPYLAQYVGVQIPQGTPDATARALIKAHAGTNRGTLQALIATVQAYLTGSKTVLVTERDGDPYNLTVRTYAAETPYSFATTWQSVETSAASWTALEGTYATWGQIGQPAPILNAIAVQKPAGIILNYQVIAGEYWSDVVAQNASWSAVQSTYHSWMLVEQKLPG